MPDGFREFEAVLGALSKMTSDETRTEDLIDAKCPKCESTSFIKVTDLYDQARDRAEESPESINTPRDGGVTDAQAIARFAPPQRRAPAPRIVAAAVILGIAVYFVFRYFGASVAQFAGAGAVVILVVVTLTTMRKVSDDFYDRRARWRKLYMCRNCGQLIAS
ncbi:MAG TPA: hypothetical protein VGM82_01995 [Gemmatimonadaceae bacterium]|jgi:hypothetical protein